MKKFMNFIILLCVFIINFIPIKATTNSLNYPNVYAESAILIDASTGTILYEKNINQVNYPASITKIMTALVAIENSSLSDIIKFSHSSIFDVELTSSRIGMDVDEEITMKEALYGMMLESANEVSHAIAEHVAGDIESFSKLMNKKAKELGCLNTNFVNPHGLPDNEHVTSAYDMALITREAMKNDIFRKITSTRTYQIPPTNKQTEIRYLRNHHKFILRDTYLYDTCIGGKTGYTSVAKYTLVTIAKHGDLELISVIMKDDSSAHQYEDTKKLLDFGFDNFSIYSIADIDNKKHIDDSPFFTRFSPFLDNVNSLIYTDPDSRLILPNTASYEDTSKEIKFNDKPNANIVGEIAYKYNNEIIATTPIYISSQNKKSLNNYFFSSPQQEYLIDDKNSASFTLTKKQILIIIILSCFVICIFIYYILVELPRLRRRKAYYRKRAKNKKRLDIHF